MPTVFIPAPLREHTGGTGQLAVQARNLGEAIAALEQAFPGISEYLVEGGRIAPGLAVDIDGAIASRGLLTPVGEASEVHFLPAIGGG